MSVLEYIVSFALIQATTSSGDQIAMLEVFDENSTYGVEILEEGGTPLERYIVVSCLRGCPDARPLREQALGLPYGVFRLSDLHPLVFVLWGGGTTYAVTAYEFGPNRIRKVFDHSSRTIPSFLAKGGEVSIITTEYAFEGAGMNRPLRSHLWVWNGQDFVEGRGNSGDAGNSAVPGTQYLIAGE